MTKDPRVYLADILERANRIDVYVRDGHDASVEQLALELRASDPPQK